MNNDDDRELIQDCVKGNRQAFERLLFKYEKPVFNAAYRMLNSPDDARDVTQTVFLKVIENIQTFDPQYRFFSWIYRIALNESINCLKKQNRFDDLDEETPSGTNNPEEQIGSDQMSKGIQAAMMTIKPEYRTVIVLKHFMNCSYSEISQILDIPEKKVKSRLYSGRQLLKDELIRNGIH